MILCQGLAWIHLISHSSGYWSRKTDHFLNTQLRLQLHCRISKSSNKVQQESHSFLTRTVFLYSAKHRWTALLQERQSGIQCSLPPHHAKDRLFWCAAVFLVLPCLLQTSVADWLTSWKKRSQLVSVWHLFRFLPTRPCPNNTDSIYYLFACLEDGQTKSTFLVHPFISLLCLQRTVLKCLSSAWQSIRLSTSHKWFSST